MDKTQLLFWIIGLLLEFSLLLLFVLRGYSRRFLIFTLLLAFYIIRPLALLLLSGRIDTLIYVRVSGVLSRLDSILQILLVAEVAFRFLRDRDSGPQRKAIVAASLFTAAIAAAGLYAGAFRMQMDRAADLTGLLMIFLALWMRFDHYRGVSLRVAEGFAAFDLVWVSATIVRLYATVHRSPSLWMAASWTRSGIWIAVVVFWLVTFAMRPDPGSSGPNRLSVTARRESH